MLRSLLEELFRLIVHREQRVLPVYALMLVNSDRSLGPKLKASHGDCREPTPTATNCGGPYRIGRRFQLRIDVGCQRLREADRFSITRHRHQRPVLLYRAARAAGVEAGSDTRPGRRGGHRSCRKTDARLSGGASRIESGPQLPTGQARAPQRDDGQHGGGGDHEIPVNKFGQNLHAGLGEQ